MSSSERQIMTLSHPGPLPASETPALRDLGAALRLAFAEVAAAPLPPRLQALLDQLGDAATTPADSFKADLAAVIPHLRAYGRSLSGNADLADDLVQETMLKAWMARDRFVAGSSMRAWTHVILRNAYFSIARRARFKGEWDEHGADLLLAVPPAQEGHVALADMQRALMQLPAPQREALILIGASGMSCEEVAAISNCAVGTVKSRVARARTALRQLLDGGQLAQSRAAGPAGALGALDQIMRQAQQLSAPR
jgi:RNA polymerase sigma-70 factor (ECF subfamily)